jgi:hypothetical protein
MQTTPRSNHQQHRLKLRCVFCGHPIAKEDVIQARATGLWCSHGVRQRRDNPSLFYAVEAMIHWPDVDEAQATALDADVSARPVYTDREKKQSLKTIIHKRKGAQCHSN